MTDRRRGLATATVGGGLVATSAHLREHAIGNAERLAGVKRQRPPSAALLRTRARGIGRNRALWGAGVLTGVAGGTALGVGGHQVIWPRRDEVVKASFLREGFEGTRDAVNEKVDNVRRPAPWTARAAAIGTGAAFGAAGSQVAHKIIDRTARDTHFRPAITALAGTAAVAGSLPISSRITRHVAPGYELTPTGVRRRKSKAVRPSSVANVVETRSGRNQTPNSRHQLVPSDKNRFAKLDANYVGSGLTDRQKRARVYAAGATPLVGSVAAARQAAHLAPPEQKRSAAALQYGGAVGGGLAGAAAGAYGLAGAARRYRSVREGSEAVDRGLNNARAGVKSAVINAVPSNLKPAASRVVGHGGPGRASRLVTRMESSGGRVAQGLSRAARPLRAAPAAATVGGLGGKMIGGLAGGYIGYGEALRRERTRNSKINKYADKPGMTRSDQVKQYKRRKRNLGLATLTTTTGAIGAGALAASHGHALPRVGPTLARNKERIERIGLNSALVGGGLGSIQGAQSIGIQRRDLRAKERELQLSKAGPRLVRTAGFRQSFIRRTPKGPVRVANTVAKSYVDGKWVPVSALSRNARIVHHAGLRSAASPARGPRPGPLHTRGTDPHQNPTNQQLAGLHKMPTTASGKRNVSFGSGMSSESDRQKVLAALPRKVKRPIVVHGSSRYSFGGIRLPEGASGVTSFRAGTRRPAHIALNSDNMTDHVTRHEFVHSQGRRSAGRLQQFTSDPKKLAREEGRADALPVLRHGNPKTPTGYEQHGALARGVENDNRVARNIQGKLHTAGVTPPVDTGEYNRMRAKLGAPTRRLDQVAEDPLTRMASRAGDFGADHRRHRVRNYSIGVAAAAPIGVHTYRKRKRVAKLDTTMSHQDAKRYASTYGVKGPLPKGLPREEKMRAYEGRYIAAGGPKGEKWHKRADAFDRVTGGALAVGGVSITGQAAHDTNVGRRVATKLGVRDHALLHQRANKLGLAAGGVGALSELAHRHAAHKQAAYSNSAAGVAASALRRMRDYTPD